MNCIPPLENFPSPSVEPPALRRGLYHVLTLLAVVLSVGPAHASWWADHSIKPGSDIVSEELMIPYWAETTYYSSWNMSGETGPNFYGGITSLLNPDLKDYAEPKSASFQWTFWPHPKSGALTKVAWNHPLMYPQKHVGEGAAGKVFGEWPIQTGEWFRMVMRFWDPPKNADGTTPDLTHAGWWKKDLATGNWHMIAMMDIPVAGYRCNANAGFLEDAHYGGRKPRAECFLKFYHRLKTGEWESGTILVKQEPTEFTRTVVTDEHVQVEIASVEFPGSVKSADDKNVNVTLAFKQPPTPEFDPIEVSKFSAQGNDQQLFVAWEMTPKSSPLFSVKLRVYKKETLVMTREIRNPTAREVLLGLPAEAAECSVEAEMTDIYDRKLQVAAVQPVFPGLVPAADKEGPLEIAKLDVAAYEAATSYQFNHLKGEFNWSGMPKFPEMTPRQQGSVNGFDLSARSRLFGYARGVRCRNPAG